MKAISVRQPWASLIADELKHNETRGPHCNWKYRGPLLICASKHRMSHRELVDLWVVMCGRSVPPAALRYIAGYLFNADEMGKLLVPGYVNLPFGRALCVTNLVWLRSTEKIASITPQQERALGNFAPGRVALDLRDVRRFKEPWSVRGRQGLFDVPDELVAAYELETIT